MLKFVLVVAVGLIVGLTGCSDTPVVPDQGSPLADLSNGGEMNCPPPIQATLYCNTTPMGMVSCWIEGEDLFLEFTANPGLEFQSTQFLICEDLSEVPVNPAGKPIPGHFPYKETHGPGVTSYVTAVSLEECGAADDLFIVAHADLGGEGAWAGDSMFPALLSSGASPAMKKKPGKGNQARFFTVNIPTLHGLLLWNTLDSDYETVNSAVGPHGLINGTLEYHSCVYDEGFESAPRTGDRNIPSNYVDYPMAMPDQGTLEFWYAPTWDNWTVGCVVATFFYGREEDTVNHMAMGYNDWQNLAGVYIYGETHQDFITVRFVPQNIPEWSTEHPFHVAITWDLNQTVPQNRLKVFFDGVDVATRGGYYVATGDPGFRPDWSNAVLRMSSRLFSGDWDRHHWEGACGLLDNLKVWNCVKTDFDDRFEE